ncbi:DUF4272 domain-containing protein [Collimonas sp.]|jgi:hypothetical protein|uniref:DUF4272 domain-containing protein n=1 Tax=Collimonas sp. TaxID=1963772 RepID=UPI0039C85D03
MNLTQTLRASSLRICDSLGLPTNPSLPKLDASLTLRSATEISRRALALNVIVACSYGFSRESGLAWLQEYNLSQELSGAESAFLQGESENVQSFQLLAESLFALAWVLGLVNSFSWNAAPPTNLVFIFPNLKVQETPHRFTGTVKLRREAAVLSALDASYCIHWSCLEIQSNGQRPSVNVRAIEYRRWALEWVMGSEAWDEISLDT